jgi:hypothetical protein
MVACPRSHDGGGEDDWILSECTGRPGSLPNWSVVKWLIINLSNMSLDTWQHTARHYFVLIWACIKGDKNFLAQGTGRIGWPSTEIRTARVEGSCTVREQFDFGWIDLEMLLGIWRKMWGGIWIWWFTAFGFGGYLLPGNTLLQNTSSKSRQRAKQNINWYWHKCNLT